MKNLFLVLAAFSGLAIAAAPLNPEIVGKSVETVRRPVMVSVIGLDLATLREGEPPDVDRMIEYWLAGMDREVGNRPDLIVLPELCDMWGNMRDKEARHRWIALRGDRMLQAMRQYAKKHRCYIVYPAYRELGGRRYQNSSFLIDREGDVIARYDKIYPTVRDIEFGVVPGTEPVVAETDFGRLGMMICFDLNFWDLLERYAALKPDILAFSSYYHGDFMQQVWAYKCRAHLVASTVNRLPKDIVTPCGTFQYVERDSFRTFSQTVNTNCCVVHLDFNGEKLYAIKAKYGRQVRLDTARTVGAVVLYSENPELPVEKIVREFEMETWDEYYVRSREACRTAVEKDGAPRPKAK